VRDSIDQFFKEVQLSFSSKYNEALGLCGVSTPVKKHSDLPASRLIKILDCFNVSLYSVVKGKVDYDVVERQMRGEVAIPSKYLEGALYSLKSTPLKLVSCISNTLSKEAADEVLKTTQIRGLESDLAPEKVNLILLHDICEYVSAFYGDERVAYLGAQKALNTISMKMGNWNGKIKCLKTLMELYIEEVYPNTVGQNFTWKLESVERNGFIIGGAPKPEVAHTFETASQIPRSLEVLRRGYLKALPSAIGHKTLAIQQISSISHGEKTDTYKITSTP
tara:strand:- start:3119 stop:3952 length:834 start_codon:yes stop_codon:yes gene_type:complete